MLILALLAVPFIGLLASVLVSGFKSAADKLRSVITVLTSMASLFISVLLLKNILSEGAIAFKIPLYGPFSPSFYLDALSGTLAVLASLLWLVITLYSQKYMVHEGKTSLFNISTLATLLAVLGVFAAGDMLTMLLFFELMTISSYFWVIHRWDKNATVAGYFYLFFSLVGGLLIALGITLPGVGTGAFPALGAVSSQVGGAYGKLSILLFVIGFGIKAGMVPLHLWLSRAHSFAPTPGSALLSGLLIKVGAYGLIRVVGFVGFDPSSTLSATFGTVITVLGIASMLTGVIAALLQSDAKRLLAYHSVSQMGYVILSIGIALYLGAAGGLSLAGAVYHMINHALFKSALFLGVGIIYYHHKETNLYKMGGLIKKMPLLAAFVFIAVLGITGTPGLNGYASKSIIHHGLNLALQREGPWLKIIEILFSAVGVGTAASFAKLFYLAFLKKAPTSTATLPSPVALEDNKTKKSKLPVSLYLPLALLSAVMLFIGFAPKLFLEKLIAPASLAAGIPGADAAVQNFNFWAFPDLLSTAITLGLGILLCVAGFKTGLFHLKVPTWLTLEGLVYLVYSGTVSLLRKIRSGAKSLGGVLSNGGRRFSSFVSANLTLEKFYTLGKTSLVGISANVALLVFMLLLLFAGYAVVSVKTGTVFSGFLSFFP